MPLTERDTNAQRVLQWSNRNSLQSEPSFIRLSDENATPTRKAAGSKNTLQTQYSGFAAPTKASAAKNTPPAPARNKPSTYSGRSTPQLQVQPQSKLPRRAPTPNTAPLTSKWSTRVDDHVAEAEGAGQVAVEKALDTVTIRRYSSAAQGGQTPVQASVIEKPLPSRPVASLTNDLSPTKDGRCLLDASEKPLRLSIGGTSHEWPALTPSPNTTPTSTPAMEQPPHLGNPAVGQPSRPSSRLSAKAASMVAAASEMTRVMTNEQRNDRKNAADNAHSRVSSASSYATVKESSTIDCSIDGHPQAATSAHVDSPHVERSQQSLPRESSLRDRITSSALKKPKFSSTTKTGLTELALDATADESRPHSPSPASFSRPRPTSLSHTPSLLSISTAKSAKSAKSSKTASRLPIPDSKKATLVDVRSRRSSGVSTAKTESGLTFGGRRLDSPDPLKILDHGRKRRQLHRDNSASTTSTVPRRLLNGDNASVVSREKTSSPEGTVGSSDEDEEEVTTPSDKSSNFVKHGYKPKHVNRISGGHYGGATLKVYDEAELVLGKAPPSSSPFTGPLQTIPSQAELSDQSAITTDDQGESTAVQKRVMKPTEFPAFAERLSALQDAHNLARRLGNGNQATVRDATRVELVDLLYEAKHEDALISQGGAVGLDIETKRHINRALSMLEGNGDPPKVTVDTDELATMFGRLRTGFEKAPKKATFVEDATVAERFLAQEQHQGHSRASHISITRDAGEETTSSEVKPNDDTFSSASNDPGTTKVTIISKWSDSSVSENTSSPTFEPSPPRTTSPYSCEKEARSPGPPPKVLPKDPPRSIGFPSRIPGKANKLLDLGQPNGGSRTSSPTLGKSTPGSVRAAHEKARSVTRGSRLTMSNTRSKSGIMPTPNTKPFMPQEEEERGRVPSADQNHSSADRVPKTPRSRSKSRYVLSKINGLFSGKRDKKNVQTPPVPPIDDKHISKTNEVHITANGSPVRKPARTHPLTKMPTISPPVDDVHPALRSTPTTTSTDHSMVLSVSSENRHSLQTFSERLIDRAMRENNTSKKQRLLNFAKVLNDSLISAREAQISAETAQAAARSAQLSYEMTAKSVAMLQRLASSMNRRHS